MYFIFFNVKIIIILLVHLIDWPEGCRSAAEVWLCPLLFHWQCQDLLLRIIKHFNGGRQQKLNQFCNDLFTLSLYSFCRMSMLCKCVYSTKTYIDHDIVSCFNLLYNTMPIKPVLHGQHVNTCDYTCVCVHWVIWKHTAWIWKHGMAKTMPCFISLSVHEHGMDMKTRHG